MGVIETGGGRRPGGYVNGNPGLRLGGNFWLAGQVNQHTKTAQRDTGLSGQHRGSLHYSD